MQNQNFDLRPPPIALTACCLGHCQFRVKNLNAKIAKTLITFQHIAQMSSKLAQIQIKTCFKNCWEQIFDLGPIFRILGLEMGKNRLKTYFLTF